MKDAKGHGSNSRGIASVRHKVKDPTWTGTVITHGSKPVVSGGQPKSSNAEAAGALASALKSTQAPVHDAMSETPRVVADTSVKGATHALVKSDGTVVGRLYKKGSPAWR